MKYKNNRISTYIFNFLYNELDNINPIINKNIKYLCANKGHCSNGNII